MNIVEKIRLTQKERYATEWKNAKPVELPEHTPEMLYIGCIDARLDPVKDIGIPQGKALIHRTIGALVAGLDEKGVPRNLSESATVEFAVKQMKVKHIVVSGHTCCAGLAACLHGVKPELPYLANYLAPLEALSKTIREPTHSHDARDRAMEEGAVRQSVDNLMRYPFVADAVKKSELKLHGWVIDTATKRILEMGPQGKFEPMGRAVSESPSR